MLQYDSPEALWEVSRKMATFIYNRVPPTKQIPGEPWISPLALQYPDREAVDLTKLQPFGLTCWVLRRNRYVIWDMEARVTRSNKLVKVYS